MSNRRIFLASLVAFLAVPLSTHAQQAGKVHHLAIIGSTMPVAEMAGPDPRNPILKAFMRELRTLGYVEGRNLVVARRSAEGKPERYPDIAAEVVRMKTDVIVAGGGTMLIRRLTEGVGNIPIVMIGGTGDPVELGLVASFARPGGNVTGLTAGSGPENEPKRLQLLKEAIPKLSRVAYLVTKEGWDLPIAQAIRRAAPSLGVKLLHAEHTPADIDATLEAVARLRADALFASASLETYAHRHQIVRFALKTRLPGIYPVLEMAETGGLMSYGVSASDLGRQAAHYVDKILKGARPGDLPIERPARFELVINLKTAKALGVTVPQSVLLRADRLIE
jgi:ABC-type uncharacterized transport system substrate-binding protein